MHGKFSSPPSSVYSFPDSTRTGKTTSTTRSKGSNDFTYNMEDHRYGSSNLCTSASEKCYKYLRRILRFRQMDFEFALWQMFHLFISPTKVYRNFQYRKQTKNQFARDDPAFLVLMSICLCVTSIGFGLVMHLTKLKILKLLLWVVFIDCIGVGLVIATIMWALSNRYMMQISRGGGIDIEWGYAFDVHLNAFFPVLMILHFFQLFLINVLIDKDWFVSTLIGNTFWLVALSYYVYITFLGYNVLPNVRKSAALLLPMILLVCIYLITLLARWNITKGLLWFYENRV